MSSVNKVIIVGRLGNDPEVRSFQNGGGVTNISVATSERWTDKNTGERREQTEWHRISLFNRLGEIAAQFLRKGSMVYVEGSLQTRKYTDQQGIERYSTEIRASEMRMLSSNNDQNGYGNNGGDYGNRNNYGNGGDYGRNPNMGYQNQNNQSWNNNQNRGLNNNPNNDYYQGNQNLGNQNLGNQNHQGMQGNQGNQGSYTNQQRPIVQNGFANQQQDNQSQSMNNAMPNQNSMPNQNNMAQNNSFGTPAPAAPKLDTPPAPKPTPSSGPVDDDMPF